MTLHNTSNDDRPHRRGLSTGRYWEMVQRLKINQFYGAPTAIRLLLKYGDQWVQKYDRSTLKTLGTGTKKLVFSFPTGLPASPERLTVVTQCLCAVGEPINTEAWEWYHKVVGDGRCPVVDTWWQTGNRDSDLMFTEMKRWMCRFPLSSS